MPWTVNEELIRSKLEDSAVMRTLSKREKVILAIMDAVGGAIDWIWKRTPTDDNILCCDSFRNLLVLEPWGIGDLVIASYCLPSLRRCFNKAKITVICSPITAELIVGCPYIDEVITYRFPWTQQENKYSPAEYHLRSLVEVTLRLRKSKFDIALSGRPDARNNFLMWLFGAKTRVGFGSRGGGFFLTTNLLQNAESQHALLRWQAVLKAAGCSQDLCRHGFWLSNEELHKADQILSEAGVLKRNILVGIHSGASNAERRWPVERFRELADQISRQPDVTVLIFSDVNGHEASSWNSVGIMLPEVNVRILAALLSKIDVLVCNDSGPMHIADAVGTAVVALFGRSDPTEFGPAGPGHTILEAKADCRPCYVRCRYSEPKCWDTITVPEVQKAVENIILGVCMGRPRKKETILVNGHHD